MISKALWDWNMNQEEREKLVLKYVVRHHIHSGAPVGSRLLSKQLPFESSPATIRNIMADLEEKGYLGHPHKSAGRIPTDLGYRAYVDAMLDPETLSAEEEAAIQAAVSQVRERITGIADGVEEILFYTSRALARISNELGIILSPRFNLGVLEKLDLLDISGGRILIELTLKTGVLKTVVLEAQARLSREYLLDIRGVLNERLSGLTVAEIRRTIDARLKDLPHRFEDNQRGFVRLLLNASDLLFNFDGRHALNYAGAGNILAKPDFAGQNEAMRIIQMLEDSDRLVDHLTGRAVNPGVGVTIGTENGSDIPGVSIVTAHYGVGGVYGVVGVVGPRRMPYGKIIPLVDRTAQLLGKALNPA